MLDHFRERGRRSAAWIEKQGDIAHVTRNSAESDLSSHPIRFMPMTGLAGLALWDDLPEAKKIPPIHDISTDLADPPVFSAAVVAARTKVPGGNGVDLVAAKLPDDPRFGPLAGKPVIEVQRAAYGDIKPLVTDSAAFDAFQVALDTAQAQKGWVVDRNDAATGMIEAHATSFWYGFTDDIVIRVRALPDDSGTMIDMRSTSRVGLSDLGMNARRVRAYMQALNTNLGEAATGG